jgi:hypothetical protein
MIRSPKSSLSIPVGDQISAEHRRLESSDSGYQKGNVRDHMPLDTSPVLL